MEFSRRNFSRSAAAGALGLAGAPALAKNTRQPLRAAAAEVDVTPGVGALLVGPMKPAEGVHDPLFARALVVENGSTRVVLATLDYLGFDIAFTDQLVAAIAAAAGVPPAQVLLNCSHTHSAPLTAPWGPWLADKNLDFHGFLPERLAAITKKATGALRPAAARYTRAPVQIGFNRRLIHDGRVVMATNPGGAVLPWVDALGLWDADGGLLASLFAHAAHPVIVHDTSPSVSADFPGFAVAHLKRRYPQAVHLFAQGPCGNINAFPLKGGFGAARAAGRELGAAALRALDPKLSTPQTGALRHAAARPELPLQTPPPAEELRAIVAREKNPGKRARREALLAIAESGAKPGLQMPLGALAVGELCITAMAHEPFVEYGQFVDRHSPAEFNMTLGYTGGLEAYVGTARDYELGDKGGYETSPSGAALMFEKRLPLAPEAERIVKQGLAGLWKTLGR